ncbi:MAG: alanine dehydrogenase [Nitrospirae bacterium]|nr:alanine dehydrogenase [Candidatus Manganitrophaceae bacterium]
MKIGVPKEIKDHEYRVSVIPAGVGMLRRGGHPVWVEAGAGEGSGIPDAAYRKAGARIVTSREKLFDEAELIVKVKEPLASEYDLFHPGQILFTYLHLAAEPALLEALLKGRVTAIAYETIALADGNRPLLRPMSEVAGRMAVLVGAHYLQRPSGGIGLLLSGLAGVEKGRVTVLGGGVVGKNAAQVALSLGAVVTVIDENAARRASLDDFFRGQVTTLPPYRDEIAAHVAASDLVIGAVARSAEKAPHLVTRQMISKMRKGSVVVDVSIDQGGCFETSRPTSHSKPTYEVDGVIHYCVANMPGAVPRSSTFALAGVTFPYLEALARFGLKRAVASDPALANGVNLYDGKIVHPDVAKVFGKKAVSLSEFFGA